MIYIALAVLLLGQVTSAIALLRLAKVMRQTRATIMSTHPDSAGNSDVEHPPRLDDIPLALRPGTSVPALPEERNDGGGQQWRIWVVLSQAQAAIAHELARQRREHMEAFHLQVLFIDQVPPDLSGNRHLDTVAAPTQIPDSHVPSVCMIDPQGVIQGAGRISTAEEIDSFITEGIHHGLGPAPIDATFNN